MAKRKEISNGQETGWEEIAGYSHGVKRPFLTKCVHTKSLSTPSWRQTKVKYRFKQSGTNVWIESNWIQAVNFRYGAFPTLPSSVWSEPDRLTSVTRAAVFDDMSEELQKGQIGVFLATMGQTIRAIRNPMLVLSAFHKMSPNHARNKSACLKDIYLRQLARFNAMSDHKKLRLGLPRQLLQTGISGRLELKYGWEPFLGDVHDFGFALMQAGEAQRAAAKQCTAWRTITRRKKSRVNEEGEPPSLDNGYSLSLVGVQRARTMLTEVTTSVQVRPAVPALEHDPYEKLHKATRLVAWIGQVGWEVIPYSFVIDSMLPIGAFLENLGKKPAYEARSAPYGSNNVLSQIHTVDETRSTYLGMTSTTQPASNTVGGCSIRKVITDTYVRDLAPEPSALDVKPSTGLTYNRGINFACLVSQVLLRDFTRSK